MASSDLERRLYGEKIVVIHLGTLTNVDKDADNIVVPFVAPRNLQLVAIGAAYLTGDASGSGLTAKFATSGGTILASGPALTGTAATGGITDGYNVSLTKDTLYGITLRSVNDTDDFTGAAVFLVFEAPKSDD